MTRFEKPPPPRPGSTVVGILPVLNNLPTYLPLLVKTNPIQRSAPPSIGLEPDSSDLHYLLLQNAAHAKISTAEAVTRLRLSYRMLYEAQWLRPFSTSEDFGVVRKPASRPTAQTPTFLAMPVT